MNRLHRRAGVVALCLAAFLMPATGSYALWSTIATGTGTVTTATPTPSAPTNVACGDLTQSGRLLTWSAVGAGYSYRVYDVTSTPAVQVGSEVSTTSIRITKGQSANNSTYAVRSVLGSVESVNGTPLVQIQWQADRCS